MSKDKCLIFLLDIIKNFQEFAVKARNDLKNNEFDMFNLGYVSAYHQIFMHLVNQANVWNIKLKDLGLEDFDPDRDLLGLEKADTNSEMDYENQ